MCQNIITSRDPTRTYKLPHLGQLGCLVSNGPLQFSETSMRKTIHREMASQHVSELSLKARVVEFWAAFVTMGRHNDNSRITTNAQSDELAPCLNCILLLPLSRPPDQQV